MKQETKIKYAMSNEDMPYLHEYEDIINKLPINKGLYTQKMSQRFFNLN